MTEVTRVLNAIDAGDPHAASQLLPLVYDELRRLAAQKLAHEAPGQTLDATSLVHEAYLRLVHQSGDRERAGERPLPHGRGSDDEARFADRRHFYAAAAVAMRRILVDRARRRKSVKHGGERRRENLDGIDCAAPERSDDLVALDEALTRFSGQDPVKAELVKLRYFAGLSLPQAARTLGLSDSTADRYWAYARAWLFREISHG